MRYLRFIDCDFFSHIVDNKKGVYKLYSLTDEGTPKPVNRILGTDFEGVLYIGCSPDRPLQDRLKDAIKAFSPNYKSCPHSGGRKYSSMPKVQKAFPFQTLAITYEITDEPRKRETELIEEYCQIFGEEPPLNSSK